MAFEYVWNRLVVAQFENIPVGGPPPGREIRGDAYMDVGGRKRPEQDFEGAAPTADEFKLSHYQQALQASCNTMTNGQLLSDVISNSTELTLNVSLLD